MNIKKIVKQIGFMALGLMITMVPIAAETTYHEDLKANWEESLQSNIDLLKIEQQEQVILDLDEEIKYIYVSYVQDTMYSNRVIQEVDTYLAQVELSKLVDVAEKNYQNYAYDTHQMLLDYEYGKVTLVDLENNIKSIEGDISYTKNLLAFAPSLVYDLSKLEYDLNVANLEYNNLKISQEQLMNELLILVNFTTEDYNQLISKIDLFRGLVFGETFNDIMTESFDGDSDLQYLSEIVMAKNMTHEIALDIYERTESQAFRDIINLWSSEQNLEKAEIDYKNDVENLNLDLKVALNQVDLSSQYVTVIEEKIKYFEAQYEVGLINEHELEAVNRELYSAKTNVIKSEYLLRTKLIQMAKMLNYEL